MTLETFPSRGHRIAHLAAGGLLAGLTACAGAPPTEVVVDATPSSNTESRGPIASPGDTTTEEEEAEEAAAPPPQRVARGPQVDEHPARETCCKGLNDCKGLGGCKTDQHECAGKNNCKGLGGCKMGQCESALQAPPPPPSRVPRGMKPSHVFTPPTGNQMCCKGQNDCKGKGNCKTGDNACKGLNECKAKGGCAGPC